jgi:hypothetical protein
VLVEREGKEEFIHAFKFDEGSKKIEWKNKADDAAAYFIASRETYEKIWKNEITGEDAFRKGELKILAWDKKTELPKNFNFNPTTFKLIGEALFDAEKRETLLVYSFLGNLARQVNALIEMAKETLLKKQN